MNLSPKILNAAACLTLCAMALARLSGAAEARGDLNEANELFSLGERCIVNIEALRCLLAAPGKDANLSNSTPLDPEMPAQELRLHMGELTPDEVLVARAAIAWANRTMIGQLK